MVVSRLPFRFTHFGHVGCFSLPQSFLPRGFYLCGTLWVKCFSSRFLLGWPHLIIQDSVQMLLLSETLSLTSLSKKHLPGHSMAIFFMTHIIIWNYLHFFFICLMENSHLTNPKLRYWFAFSKPAASSVFPFSLKDKSIFPTLPVALTKNLESLCTPFFLYSLSGNPIHCLLKI